VTALLAQAALLVTALGLISAVCVGLRVRRLQHTVAVLTDFLLAAGLLRLATVPKIAAVNAPV
jgi:hypothetical protein